MANEQQMKSLASSIARLEMQLGKVAGQMAELSKTIAPFLARYQRDVLRYHQEVAVLQREIMDLRGMIGDSDALAPGEAESPLNKILATDYEGIPSVEEQYRRIQEGYKGVFGPESETLPPASEAVKRLYGKAISLTHPDLARTLKERKQRAPLVNRVNTAYLKRDEMTLQIVVDSYTPQSNLPIHANHSYADEMRQQALKLEQLIQRLEGQLYDVQHGDVARVWSQAQEAKNEDRDLLSELSTQLQELRSAKQRERDELRAKMRSK